MFLRVVIAAFFLSLCTSVAMAAESVAFVPVVTAQAEDAGGGYVLRSPVLQNGLWIGPSQFGEERAIVEYDLASFDFESGLNTAWLEIFWRAWGYSETENAFPTVHIYGYLGSYSASSSDAYKTDLELTTYVLGPNTPSIMTIPLPVDFLRNVVAMDNQQLGLLFTVTGPQTGNFAAIHVASPYPTLSLVVPEPGLMVASAAMFIGIFHRPRGARRLVVPLRDRPLER